jgi:creatinine amidohydrolase
MKEKRISGDRNMSDSIFTDTMMEMTWQEIERAIQQNTIAILPLGAIEEHGPHLTLGVDIFAPCRLARMIKENLTNQGISVLIAPPYYWGNIGLTGAFPGSFSFKPGIIRDSIYEIISCLNKWGINRIFTLNWHAEYKHNMAAIEAVKKARSSGIQAYACLTEHAARNFKLDPSCDYLIAPSVITERGFTAEFPDVHAGSTETALMMEYYPDQVRKDILPSLKPTRITFKDLANLKKSNKDPRELIKDGYFGDPASYDQEYCKMYLNALADTFTYTIKAALNKLNG